MDKKDFLAIANAIVEQVAAKNGITEREARSLVGLTLKASSQEIADACQIRKVALPS